MVSVGQAAAAMMPHLEELLAAFDLAGMVSFDGQLIGETLKQTTVTLRKRARMQVEAETNLDKRLAVLHANVALALLDVYEASTTLSPGSSNSPPDWRLFRLSHRPVHVPPCLWTLWRPPLRSSLMHITFSRDTRLGHYP